MPLKTDAALRKDQRNAGSDMQHQHFATVAAIIKELRDEDRQSIADFFAERLAGTNPKFDRRRFLLACGVPE